MFRAVIDPIPDESELIVGRIVVPYGLKKRLLSELELFGVSAGSLFCDNIDMMCGEIRDRFESLTGDGQ